MRDDLASDEPPASDDLLSVSPSVVEAGGKCYVMFPDGQSRRGYFWLSRWAGAGWEEPSYLLQSRGREPQVTKLEGQRVLIHDYGVSGPQPDDVVLPSELIDGWWRLCSVDLKMERCARLRVRRPAQEV